MSEQTSPANSSAQNSSQPWRGVPPPGRTPYLRVGVFGPAFPLRSARVCIASTAPIKCVAVPEAATKPRIALGADHAGFHLKEIVKKYLTEAGYVCDDMGTSSEESVDYPDFARAVAERVSAGQDDLGILACGTGIGMAIAAR